VVYRSLLVAAVAGSSILAGCGGGGGTAATANSVPLVSSMTRSAEVGTVGSSVSFDAPKIIYVGFTHAALPKSKYGPVAFYAPTNGPTKLITVKAGAKVAFLNDDTSRHTASGLGSTGFPKSFDNTSGITRNGTAINSGLTWSTGALNPGVTSQTFTVGPAGVYFFGCYYHYSISPAMRDVIVSQST